MTGDMHNNQAKCCVMTQETIIQNSGGDGSHLNIFDPWLGCITCVRTLLAQA